MKKVKHIFVFALLLVCLFAAQSVFAEGDGLNTVKVIFFASDIPTIAEGDVVMNLYSEDGSALLDTKTVSVKRGYKLFEVVFTVPEYKAGTKFKFTVTGAVSGAEFNGTKGSEHILETYAMPDEEGVLQNYNTFWMNLIHNWTKEVSIKIPGVDKTLYYHCATEDEVYVTTDLLETVGINVQTDFNAAKPNFTLTSDGGAHIAQFYVDDIYASFNYNGENLKAPAFKIGELPYVPLSRVAEFFDCSYQVIENSPYAAKISLDYSKYSDEVMKAAYVNSLDIDSRTNYLVWVDKSEFTVNVYLGSNKNWRHVKSFPCAIGAPGTPTIEGRFEYIQWQTRWQYNGYYCGPILRFYRGYAFHSVLMRNNGGFYDGSVGVRISHGCIRMLPDDIKWMSDYLPLYTRILITA